MSNESKSPNWGKIFKIIGEFVVAILTAIFASNFVLPHLI